MGRKPATPLDRAYVVVAAFAAIPRVLILPMPATSLRER
jgi:hypothetical protein